MEEENPKKTDGIRDAEGKFVKGNPGSPGRPKGETMKEFARRMLMTMDDEQKRAYLKKLPPEITWRMAEGNPHQTSDVVGEITVAQPLLNALRNNDSNTKGISDVQADQSDSGGDISGQDGGNG